MRPSIHQCASLSSLSAGSVSLAQVHARGASARRARFVYGAMSAVSIHVHFVVILMGSLVAAPLLVCEQFAAQALHHC